MQMHFATAKKEKDETIVSSKKMKNGSRIPDDFYPSEEMLKWAKETLPDINLDLRITEFKNYWESKTGKDATKLDWNKTFQNRILQIAEYQVSKNGVNANGKNTESSNYSHGNNGKVRHGENSGKPERSTADILGAIGAKPANF
jgi:hypothetical protein